MGTSNLRGAVPVGDTSVRSAGVDRARVPRPRRVPRAGPARQEFRYRQPGVFVGLGITLVTLAALTRTR